MKKNIYYILAILLIIISCEKDDFCIDDTTPSLILKFYDSENEEDVKSIVIDSVRALNMELIANYTNKTLDSIFIPLDINKNITSYEISSGSTSDTIYFNYDLNDVFVSRSCGYKTIFKNLTIDRTTNNWIKSYNIKTTIIDNDTTAHINIYH